MMTESEAPNLSAWERIAYVGAGLALAGTALKPRPNPLLSAVALAGGSYLAWRGYVGQCPVKAALIGKTSTPNDPSVRTWSRRAYDPDGGALDGRMHQVIAESPRTMGLHAAG
jgi:hypothetical protein